MAISLWNMTIRDGFWGSKIVQTNPDLSRVQCGPHQNDEEPKKNGGSMKRPAAIGSLNQSLQEMRGGAKKTKKSDDEEGRSNAEKS